MKHYYVYILTNTSKKTLYIGVTNNIERRMYEHKKKLVAGFSSKYNLNKLVYVEETSDVHAALNREKQLKNWHRTWKDNLISEYNPGWKDLAEDLDPETSSG